MDTGTSAAGFSEAEHRAMLRALQIAATPGVPLGPNPRVGCVLLDGDGRQIAEGFHHGAGTPHAEVMALAALAEKHPGGTATPVAGLTTAVVTLEPCDHTGRTGPCTQALLAAGVSRVVFARPDPNPVAAGGAATLRAAGVDVAVGLEDRTSAELNHAWRFGLENRRPFVTWKFASTLDGRSAAADGTSRWVSSRAARLDTHRLRAACDVVLVGTNTVALDDPWLTVRDENDAALPHQPLRAVMGLRDLPPDVRIFDDAAQTVQLRTRDPRAALAELFEMGRRHVFAEGGPTLAAALLRAGVIDEVVGYIAPKMLGAGASMIGDLGVTTIAQAHGFELVDARVIGAGDEANLRVIARPAQMPAAQRPAAQEPAVETRS